MILNMLYSRKNKLCSTRNNERMFYDLIKSVCKRKIFSSSATYYLDILNIFLNGVLKIAK